MAVLRNLARMTTPTVGQGDLTLGAAVTGFLSLAQAGVVDGDSVSYGIFDYDGSGNHIASEVGRGTYNAGLGTLTRNVLDSTNGGAPIVLSGNAQVFVTVLSEDIPTDTSGLPDSVDKRYVTDAQLAVLANTSGVNTGDQDLSPYISGTGVVGQVAEFVTDTKTLQAANLIAPSANILTLTNAAASTLALNITAGKTLTLTAADNYTLTIPATGTAALLGTAQTFTAAQKINVNSTTALFVEQDGVKDNVLVVDTTNGRIGINRQPLSMLEAQVVGGSANFRFFTDSDVQGGLSTVDFIRRPLNGTSETPTSASIGSVNYYTLTSAGAERLVARLFGRTSTLSNRYTIQFDKWDNITSSLLTFMDVDPFNRIMLGTGGTPTLASRVTVSGTTNITQFQVIGNSTQTLPPVYFWDNTSATNTVRNILKIETRSTGTAANGLGAGFVFSLETATADTLQDAGLISASWVEATNATRKAKLSLSAYDTAARLGLEIEASGTEPKIGFYGVAPIARAVLATGAGASVDDVITALQNLGLVKQS